MITRYFLPVLLLSLCTTACTTYHITTVSLKEQMERLPDSKTYKYPPLRMFPLNRYNGRPPITITVQNKKDQYRIIPVTTHTGIRVTQTNGKKVSFKLSCLKLRDDRLTGMQSVIFNRTAVIPLEDIKKIELQY